MRVVILLRGIVVGERKTWILMSHPALHGLRDRTDQDLVVLPDEHVHQRALSDPGLWFDSDPEGGHGSYVEVDLFGTR